MTTTLAPTAISAAAGPAPQSVAGAKLEKANIILMEPGTAYRVQMAGSPAEVKLVQNSVPPASDGEDASIRNQLSVNGTVVRGYSFAEVDGLDQGDVYLVPEEQGVVQSNVAAPEGRWNSQGRKTLKIQNPAYVEPSSYLWYRCNAKGKKCKGIALNVKKGIAATAPTYRLAKADRKKRVKVCADYSYEHWADWVCSKASGKVT